MRTRLVLLLLAILGVGWYSYHYYQSRELAKIDSYETCISAKGSIIQESYPATCVTRTGLRFTQKLFGVVTNSTAQGWSTFYSTRGYEFSFPPDWQVDDSKFGDELVDQLTIIYGTAPTQYTITTKAAGRDGPNAEEILNEDIVLDDIQFTKRTWIHNQSPFLISIIGSVPYFNHIEITLPQNPTNSMLETIDQILESFHFTDQ